VRTKEVIAVVAGTRSKSGSTDFLRLHALGDLQRNGMRSSAERDRSASQTSDPEVNTRRADGKQVKEPKRK